jgi:hypothetical protein
MNLSVLNYSADRKEIKRHISGKKEHTRTENIKIK